MKYEKLKTKFSKSGDDYEQVFREDDWAIYRRTNQKFPDNVRYEVIRIKKAEEREIYGKTYPPSEIYPSATTWGTYGWTILGTLEKAKNYLFTKRELVKDRSIKRKKPAVVLNRMRVRST